MNLRPNLMPDSVRHGAYLLKRNIEQQQQRQGIDYHTPPQEVQYTHRQPGSSENPATHRQPVENPAAQFTTPRASVKLPGENGYCPSNHRLSFLGVPKPQSVSTTPR